MTNELTDMLDKLIEEGTFSVKATEGIQQLRADLDAANEKAESLEGQLATAQEKNADQARRITDLTNDNTALTTRNEGLQATIEDMQIRDREAIAAIASGNAYKHALETVFKPPQVRTDVWQNYTRENYTNMHVNPDGSSTPMPISSTSTTTTVEET